VMTLSPPVARSSALPWATAAGSVTGRDHKRAERDGQDGFALVAMPTAAAAIVTDGCSSGRASEVGARLGAAWIAALLEEHLAGGVPDEAAARSVAGRVVTGLVARIEQTARGLDHDGRIATRSIADLFLFGFLAGVVTEDTAFVFGVGDGVAWIDGAHTIIDPGPENAPVYPAYALLGARIEPRILFVAPAAGVDTIAVATDGLAPLFDGNAEPSFGAIVSDPRYLTNPSLLRKRLVVLSDRGAFSDDATIALVMRRKAVSPASPSEPQTRAS
jgi:hypothetical protein